MAAAGRGGDGEGEREKGRGRLGGRGSVGSVAVGRRCVLTRAGVGELGRAGPPGLGGGRGASGTLHELGRRGADVGDPPVQGVCAA